MAYVHDGGDGVVGGELARGEVELEEDCLGLKGCEPDEAADFEGEIVEDGHGLVLIGGWGSWRGVERLGGALG